MIPVEELIAAADAEESDGNALAQLELGALEFIQIQTDRYFGPPELVSEFLEGKGTGKLWLRDRVASEEGESDQPITVTERTYPGESGTELVKDTDFALRQGPREFMLVRLGALTWTLDYEYEVEYWRGYEEDSEPADIRQLVLDLVTVRWANGGQIGFKSETIGGYSYTRFGEGDVDAVSGGWSTIKAWKRPVYA